MAIDDMLKAATDIRSYVQGKSFENFMDDSMCERAVVQCLIVIGEATRRVPEETQGKYPTIEWHSMRGIRNILVHQYDDIDYVLVWRTATVKIPILLEQLNRIAQDYRV